MATTAYKQRVITWLHERGGATTADVRAKFPRAPLREMEKTDRTIEYVGDRWLAK